MGTVARIPHASWLACHVGEEEQSVLSCECSAWPGASPAPSYGTLGGGGGGGVRRRLPRTCSVEGLRARKQGEWQAEEDGEADSPPSREPDVGLHPSHPGTPDEMHVNMFFVEETFLKGTCA